MTKKPSKKRNESVSPTNDSLTEQMKFGKYVDEAWDNLFKTNKPFSNRAFLRLAPTSSAFTGTELISTYVDSTGAMTITLIDNEGGKFRIWIATQELKERDWIMNEITCAIKDAVLISRGYQKDYETLNKRLRNEYKKKFGKEPEYGLEP